MPDFDFDLIVIGAGSGGVRASRMAAKYGAKVAIIEDNGVGGTCVLRGCIPKKLLVYASRYSEEFQDARAFGWDEARVNFDWPRLIANKDKEISRLNGVYIKLLKDSGVTLIEGRARVTGPNSLEVGGKPLRAKTLLVATGSKPVLPDVPGVGLAITSNEAFHLGSLPERIVIVGGGYIAVEFAGIFHGLGSEVALLLRGDRLLRGFDDDLRAALGEAMRINGIEIHAAKHVRSIRRHGGALAVETMEGDEFAADAVMFAIGRAPNTEGLGLAEIGVKLDANGAIVVDEYSRTFLASIYAVGDVTARKMLTPVAIAEGAAFAETVFNENPKPMDHSLVPAAVFSQPPIATVGLTESHARKVHRHVNVYRSQFRPLKHTLSGRNVRSLMKLVVDGASDRVLGCHMIGEDAPEIIQGLAVALTCGATKAQFDATIGIHPTAAEEFVTMREKAPEPVEAA
ncbi:MAG TPA: glutathione-disulfide reductase [Rhodospirillales bacterium]